MTGEELAEIKAREQAAAPGPWWISANFKIIIPKGGALEKSSENMIFIARARQDVPALIVEVERLNAENERLTRELDAAVADLEANDKCQTCKDYNRDDDSCYRHYGRGAGGACEHHDNWQWRGVRE